MSAKPSSRPDIQEALIVEEGVRPVWYKRRYLIYPKFQTKLILANTLMMGIFLASAAALMLRSYFSFDSLARQIRSATPSQVSPLIEQHWWGLLVGLSVVFVIGLVVTAMTTLLFSHKIAGSMVRMRSYFNKIGKTGEFPESLNLREGDFFYDISPIINQAFNAIKRKGRH